MSKTQIVTGGIADDAVSEEHLDATAITGSTELAATPADTDEILISDAGTLKRIDFSYIKSLAGTQVAVAGRSGNQTSISDNSWTKVEYNQDRDDPSSNFDTTNDRFIAPADGRYFFTATAYCWGYIGNLASRFYKNGSAQNDTYFIDNAAYSGNQYEFTARSNAILDLSANDYIEFWIKSNTNSGTTVIDEVGTQFLAFRLD